MNKNCYSLIFNKARGLLMAVAETTLSQGKASGETSASSRNNARSLIAATTVAIRPLAFFVWGLFGVVMTAYAQILADPTAAANQRPTVLTAPNAVPLVNIQTPSAAGVSRNTYSQFDVQQQGAILNNSRANVQTQLGGWVQGNPWLATGSARVILNEVNSNHPSLLRGYVEVAGQRAQIVIANPSGVTCDGCGFINANRATLTTGTPTMSNGNLEGFRVQSGMVTIAGNGMDASTTDYTDIIARAVQVNAGLWANQLKVVTGTNQVSIDQTSNDPSVSGTTAGTETDAAPAFAIDTAQLGGMYAGKITLLATEAGVGVRNAGKIHAGKMYASVGEVSITANGQLQNAGQITSRGQTHIDTQHGVQNTGTVYAQGNATITTRGDIHNSGANAVIAAQNDTTLNTTGTSSQITSTRDSILAAGVQTDGTLGTSGNLTASATQSLTAQGKNLSGGDQSLTAQAIDLSGSQTNARNLSVTASSGDINLTDATIAASDTLTALAAQTWRTDGAKVSAHQITTSAHDLSNVRGQIVQTGSGDMALDLPGKLDNTEGRMASNGATTLTVGALKNQGGTIQAAGPAASDLSLIATAEIDNSNAGTISASGNLTIASDSLDNTQGQVIAGQALTATTTHLISNTQGLLAANGQLTLAASQIDNQAGTIGSVRDALSITAQTGALNNQTGRIEAAKTTTISAVGMTNTDGIITGKSLSANSQNQSFNNTRGKLIASGTGEADTLDVQSGALTNDSGLIQGASALTVHTHGQTLTNTNSGASGGIVGQSTVNLDTGDINNQAGYIGSHAALTIHSAAITNIQGGHILSRAAATMNANSLDNQGGQIQAVGNADIRVSHSLNNTGSLVRSGQSLTIAAASIHNSHTTGANQGLEGNDVALSAASIDNTAGAIRANNDTTLNSSATVNNTDGLVSAGNTLTVQDTAANKTLSMTNTNGTLIAGQQLTVDSASVSGDGKLLSRGNLNIKLRQSVSNTGHIIANGNATVETDATLTNQGMLAAGGKLDAKAATIDNQTGGSISANKLTLQATDTLTNRGILNGATETVLDTPTLSNLGTGKIYGDHIAIGATTVTNAAENGTAPVIAARDRLDIGAGTIDNREHAILLSGGDIAIGGSLDASKRATGQASTLNNASATIEALGNADINARTINNTNEHFQYGIQIESVQNNVREDPSATQYRLFTRTISTPVASHSDPATLRAGKDLRITSEHIRNDMSHIIAGGALTARGSAIINNAVYAERSTRDTGTTYSLVHVPQSGTCGWIKVNCERAHDEWWPSAYDSTSSRTVAVAQITPAQTSGTQAAAFQSGAVNQNPSPAQTASVTPKSGQVITPITQITQITAPDDSNASGPATVVRSGGINTSVPNNRLFGISPNPTAHYLIETDPAFANYRTWLSSDYLLNALSLDPALTQKRLGDGFYEQKLIREQVAQLTGRRFLDGYANDEAQYQAVA